MILVSSIASKWSAARCPIDKVDLRLLNGWNGGAKQTLLTQMSIGGFGPGPVKREA